ncbi:MAG: hypothetical protein IH582_10695 [Afipia sp.]|nr:hypothetical protein [Afipia sp.]
MSAAALEAMREIRQEDGFDEAVFIKSHLRAFAALYSISISEAGGIIRASRQKTAARFEWLAAVSSAAGQGFVSLKGVLVANVLFQHFNDSNQYAWPSWQTIARLAGWSESNRQGVAEGLNQLTRIGAIERVPVRNCPPEIARQILNRKSKGGSGRDPRSVAFKRIDVAAWRTSDLSTDHRHISVHEPETLNHKGKPQRLRRDSSSTEGSSSESLMTAATSQNLNDGANERQVAYG